jgi:hypothetical protein
MHSRKTKHAASPAPVHPPISPSSLRFIHSLSDPDVYIRFSGALTGSHSLETFVVFAQDGPSVDYIAISVPEKGPRRCHWLREHSD